MKLSDGNVKIWESIKKEDLDKLNDWIQTKLEEYKQGYNCSPYFRLSHKDLRINMLQFIEETRGVTLYLTIQRFGDLVINRSGEAHQGYVIGKGIDWCLTCNYKQMEDQYVENLTKMINEWEQRLKCNVCKGGQSPLFIDLWSQRKENCLEKAKELAKHS